METKHMLIVIIIKKFGKKVFQQKSNIISKTCGKAKHSLLDFNFI